MVGPRYFVSPSISARISSVDLSTTGPCEPFEPIGSIGPPSCLLSYNVSHVIHRQKRTNSSVKIRYHGVSWQRRRERRLSRRLGNSAVKSVTKSRGPNSISLTRALFFSPSYTPRCCYARHPSRRLPPRGRSLIYNEPSVIILWSRDYTRGDVKARLRCFGFRVLIPLTRGLWK